MPKYSKTAEALISRLSPEQYRVTQQNGTELGAGRSFLSARVDRSASPSAVNCTR